VVLWLVDYWNVGMCYIILFCEDVDKMDLKNSLYKNYVFFISKFFKADSKSSNSNLKPKSINRFGYTL
jgi:hypothetical protein